MKAMIDKFDGEYKFLSNFYPSVVRFGGAAYPTVENAYQAAKCANPSERKWFRDITPGKAKRLGRQVQIRHDWESVKVSIMFNLLEQKFTLHEDLREKLLATEGKKLVEGNTWGDTFWGVCDGSGQNVLGKLLMGIRAKTIPDNK